MTVLTSSSIREAPQIILLRIRLIRNLICVDTVEAASRAMSRASRRLMPLPGVTLANETGGLAMETNLVPAAAWRISAQTPAESVATARAPATVLPCNAAMMSATTVGLL